MSMFRLTFSGHIKRVETKTVGGKPLVEFSLCRKNKTKEGDEDAFTWVRVALWDAKDFQIPRIVKGAYISGSGDCVLRSYVNKEGIKAQSLEVRCGSFDIDQPDERVSGDAPTAARPAIQRPLKDDHAKAAAADDSDSVPF